MPNDRADRNNRLIDRSTGASPASSAPQTRLVGTRVGGTAEPEPAEMDKSQGLPVTGWLVVVKGPGVGQAVSVYEGLNDIGRDAERAITLDFGDESISREAHAILVYEPRERTFFFNHAGQRNLVRLNDSAVLGPQPLSHGDVIEIGETHLRFVAFCGPDFDWADLN